MVVGVFTLFKMAIWAPALQAWGWSCNGQEGGGSSPPPSWVRADSTALTHSLQLTAPVHSPPLSPSLSLTCSFSHSIFISFFLSPWMMLHSHSTAAVCITISSVHMYLCIHVGGLTIIKMYQILCTANTFGSISICVFNQKVRWLFLPRAAAASTSLTSYLWITNDLLVMKKKKALLDANELLCAVAPPFLKVVCIWFQPHDLRTSLVRHLI